MTRSPAAVVVTAAPAIAEPRWRRWLAALLFDLVFVWHRYVRWSVLEFRLRQLKANVPPAAPPPGKG